MKGDLRHTFRQTFIYGISNILVKATGLILLPIYTNALSVADYGRLAYFEIIAQVCVGIFSLSIPASMLRLGSEHSDAWNRRRVYGTALKLLLLLCGVFALLFFPFRTSLSELLFDSAEYVPALSLLFCSIVFEMLGLMPLQYLRLEERSASYVTLFAAKLISMLALVWFFTSYMDMGLTGAVLGIALSNAVLFLITLPLQIRNFSLVFDVGIARELYQFGSPLIFTTIAGAVLTFADRLIIERYGTFSDVGIYSLAYKLGSISNLLIIGSFALGFLPVSYRKFREPEFDRFFKAMFTYFIGMIVLLSVAVSLFSKELLVVISPENQAYWGASILVPFIALMFVFKAMQTYFSYLFLLTKRTAFQAWITIGSVGINIGLNLVWIPTYGLYGAVAATGATYLLAAVLTWIYSSRLYAVKYEWGRISAAILLSALVVGAALSTDYFVPAYSLLIKGILVILFAWTSHRFILSAAEREGLRKLWKAVRRGDFSSFLS